MCKYFEINNCGKYLMYIMSFSPYGELSLFPFYRLGNQDPRLRNKWQSHLLTLMPG